jgi:hypothetical protein
VTLLGSVRLCTSRAMRLRRWGLTQGARKSAGRCNGSTAHFRRLLYGCSGSAQWHLHLQRTRNFLAGQPKVGRRTSGRGAVEQAGPAPRRAPARLTPEPRARRAAQSWRTWSRSLRTWARARSRWARRAGRWTRAPATAAASRTCARWRRRSRARWSAATRPRCAASWSPSRCAAAPPRLRAGRCRSASGRAACAPDERAGRDRARRARAGGAPRRIWIWAVLADERRAGMGRVGHV